MEGVQETTQECTCVVFLPACGVYRMWVVRVAVCVCFAAAVSVSYRVVIFIWRAVVLQICVTSLLLSYVEMKTGPCTGRTTGPCIIHRQNV